jgi:hypothetical protein
MLLASLSISDGPWDLFRTEWRSDGIQRQRKILKTITGRTGRAESKARLEHEKKEASRLIR